MKRTLLFFSTLLFLSASAWAQKGIIRGKVYNAVSNEPIPFANVVIEGTTQGASTDEQGNYEITDIKPGLYNVKASFIGFEEKTVFEVQVTNSRPAIVNFAMKESTEKLDEVTVVASPFSKTPESPVSLRSLGPSEIQRNPGANRDISKVVRSLPGVASTPSFRNDIVIRGGAPSENKYYLDGIAVPTINHFQTQGSSGGPVGLINVDFIKRVDFYSGAFPANRGNALSSIFEFVQKDGRSDKTTLNAIIGASDIGLTLEGPATPKSTYIFSVRRSYLQFLFKALELPFLPTYNDYQLKYKYKFDDKNQLSIISVGALDQFELNKEANDTEEQRYLLNNLPISEQWNYTIGAKYEHFREHGFTTVVASRNMLHNTSTKYRNNDESNPSNKIQDYLSTEQENRFRIEDYISKNGFDINYGANFNHAEYFVSSFQKFVTQQGAQSYDFNSTLPINRWGIFGQVSRKFFDKKLSLSLGVRADANDYSSTMRNLADQLSPRFSLSYYFTNNLSFNANTGIYYQLPPYTVLGYRDSQTNELVNKDNGIEYIKATHYVAGLEYDFNNRKAKVSVEGFYKKYDQYPFLIQDSISLANLGADFGVVGNAPVTPTSEGRAYGMEVLAQQKLSNGLYGLLAYTLVRSEFTDKTGKYVPSAWDYRQLVSLTGGYRFGKNWEIGFRWLFTGSAPYTPYDVNRTVKIENWNIRGQGVPDYDQLNTKRVPSYHQLDLRVDKKFYFDKWTLNLYFDVQNAYNYQAKLQDNIDVVKNMNGNPIEDPNHPGYYIPKFIDNTSGTILPTLGVIIEL